ncbi:MAG: hypothetical protein KAW56_08605 [Candidatus Marinimicrobia bacterium]|nr:hypothetical protein [Candidatus Neomarinimicrobiota bacterium]
MKMHSLDLLIYPLDDLHCGYGIQQGNVLPSYPYIPGRVLRGALGGWAIRVTGLDNTSDKFKALFYDNEENNISFPNCTKKGMLPAPLSLFKPKSCGEDQHAALLKLPSKVFAEREISTQFKEPLDFLRRNIMPSQVSATLKPMKNSSIDGAFIVNSPSVSLSIKNRHDEKIRRVGDDGLFIEEVIPPSNYYEPEKRYYKGTLYYSDEYKDLFEKLTDKNVSSERSVDHVKLENSDLKHLIFIGHRRIAALVYGINPRKLYPEDEQVTLGKELSVTFISDFIPKDEFSYPLTAEHITDCIPDITLKKKIVFCYKTQVHGYDVLDKKPNTPKYAFTAGSCILLECNSTLTEDQKKMIIEKSKTGIGLSTKNGYGRFIINWHIHNIEEAS